MTHERSATPSPEPPSELTATTIAEIIRATERDRLRAFVSADIPVLERLHTDDFQLINPGGRTLTKAEYLGGVAAGDIAYLVWEPSSEMDIRLYGEAAAIRYQSHTEIVVFGETFVMVNWHTDVYEWRDERWQVVWSQATSIEDDTSATALVFD